MDVLSTHGGSVLVVLGDVGGCWGVILSRSSCGVQNGSGRARRQTRWSSCLLLVPAPLRLRRWKDLLVHD